METLELAPGDDPRGQLTQLGTGSSDRPGPGRQTAATTTRSRGSYMTRSESRTLPVVPNKSVRPGTRRSNAIATLHNGQKVTATGIPPMRSLTISFQIRICSGYARTSRPTDRELDHRLAGGEPADQGGGREARMVERRDAVLAGSSGLELGQWHQAAGEIRPPASRECGIDRLRARRERDRRDRHGQAPDASYPF